MKRLILLVTAGFLLTGCDLSLTKQSIPDYHEPIQTGVTLMNEGKPDQALSYFLEAQDYANGDDTALNNISWAYYELGDSQQSWEYIQKALDIAPNTAIEYINAGNALNGLQRYDASIESFEKAVELDPKEYLAYYGLGVSHYDSGHFEMALEAFEESLLYSEDYDAKSWKLECLVTLEKYDEGLDYVNQLIQTYPDILDLYYYKADIFLATGNEKDLIPHYEKMRDLFPEDEDVHLNIGTYYYNIGKYHSAVVEFETQLSPSNPRAYYLLANALLELGDFEEAEALSEELIENFPETYLGYNVLGKIYFTRSMYMESVPYFMEASKYTQDDSPKKNAMQALYYGQRYKACIEYGLEALKAHPDHYEILTYIAYSYYMMNDHEQAIEYYKRMHSSDPTSFEVYFDIAESYYYLDDYDQALDNLDIFLKHDPENSNGHYLKDYIESTEVYEDDLLSHLFEEYYLYGYDSSQALNYSQTWSHDQVNDLLMAIKQEDDPFTFMLSGEAYEIASQNMAELNFDQVAPRVYYVYIPYFDLNTDHLFIEGLDAIQDPETAKLIIDMRGNGGGDTDSGNNILNALLPECVPSQIIYRDGYTYSYSSDASFVPLEHIYVLVDGDTASVAELVTLSLKTYLDKVTVAGQQTFGKGVGQRVYDDTTHKRLYFIVNHYWNVRQDNISGQGITPDVLLEDDQVVQYLKEIIQ